MTGHQFPALHMGHPLSLITPPSQQEIISDPRRFCVVAAGRRWGKTTFGVCKLHDSAMSSTGTYLHISPSIRMAELVYKYSVERSPGWRHIKSGRTVYTPNGSRFVFMGQQEAFNVDRWRGHSLSGIVVDEAQMCDSRLIEAVRFHLRACRAWLLLTGTPPWGRRKWLKRPRLAARLAAIRLGFDPSDVAIYLCSTESGLNVSQASLQDWRASSLSLDRFNAETLSDCV